MLEKLKIKNFQSHKSLVLDFDKHITTVIGPSDMGKSAIIRALRWVVQNNPKGSDFITYGEDKSVVRLECDGYKIIRIRGKSKNAYKLDSEKYTAFGNDVPETITKVLNISDINFQAQFDSPFWFNETAGEVSRQLNTIVNLDVIDTTLANIASGIRKQRASVDIIEKRLVRIHSRTSELSYIEEMDKDLTSIEQMNKNREKITSDKENLDDLIKGIEKYTGIINTNSVLAELGKKANKIGQQYKDIHNISEKIESMLNQIEVCNILLSKKPPSLAPLQKLYDKMSAVSKQRKQLFDIIENIEDYQEQVDDKRKNIKELEQEIHEKMGDVCPLCKRPIQ